MNTLRFSVIVWSMASSWAQSAELTEIAVFPPEVALTTALDRQTVVVQARYSHGITRDVTSESSWHVEHPELVKVDNFTLYPLQNGSTQLRVSFGGHSVTVPIRIERAEQIRPISFRLDVMPVFMRAGCNSGSCHGAARGKDGFRLSLFGFDPSGDHYRLTREFPGRRVDLAVPRASLLIEKSIGAVPHTGGQRFEADSELCRTLETWIAAGCPDDPADIPTCTAIELYPPQGVLESGSTQRVVVRARYSDGTDRDVTSLALFLSSNDSSAAISADGIITAGSRGEAFVMARFATHTVGSPYVVLPQNLQWEEKPSPVRNYIDELVLEKLRKLRMDPSPRCTDEVFLRRVYLDLVGLLPTEDEYQQFVADPAADKRDRVIDDLLQRKEFTEVWVSKWAEWLMMRSNNNVSLKSILLYYTWLSEQIAHNVPLDVMVREILGASGGTFRTPATNFYQIERDTLKVAENVAQIFMGMQIQCAQCHNHPFDRWTQDDYYSFAAFFSQIGRKQAEDDREIIVFNSGNGEVRHPVSRAVMPPVYLGGGKAELAGRDRRVVLAEWLASPQNPYFARNFVNRVWQHFFGIGIVEPVDDVRISNPPANEPLLAELARRFTASGYDFKALVRDICQSETYQRSTEAHPTNELDTRNFARQQLRRIKAETLLDVISQVTETKDKFPRLPLGARAVQIADGATSTYFLTTFGRASRQTACACEVKMEPTLSQALHLLNGETTNNKIRQGAVVERWLKAGLSREQIIEKLFVRTLTRKPLYEEQASLQALFDNNLDQRIVLEDIFWALLNSREFVFNH
ncbi:MAG: surface protein [Planctomycetaceae bacterium]|nr:MAG: surface protein [Planctomycetaceae bacterium]